MAYMTQPRDQGESNRLFREDLPIHEWYRFVLSYPPHLVRTYLDRFGVTSSGRVLDPFCGTGTTLVECKKLGIPSIGLEVNPVVHFAASTKLSWNVDPEALEQHARRIAQRVDRRLAGMNSSVTDDVSVEHLLHLAPDQEALLISGSISPVPLHKVLVLLDEIDQERQSPFWAHERLALIKQAVHTISNLRFGPEVGVSTKRKLDSPVVGLWLGGVQAMCEDLRNLELRTPVDAHVILADARAVPVTLPSHSISAVITSPPYPNEKDYSRTTRLESVLMGYMNQRSDLKRDKSQMLVSNTRNVYKGDTDEQYILNNARIQELADTIEGRRIELRKTSGFERLYAKVVRLYFGGMVRHLRELKPKLRPGAQLAYVVGDQASYFRIHIHTGEILADLAREEGFEVIGLDLFRTRFSTATQTDLREEVLLLRWDP